MPQTENNIELRSENTQEILEAVPHWMIPWGNLLFFILIVVLLFTSWFVKYLDVIALEALITTQIPPQKKYVKTTGKLSAILVNDDDLVKQNQALAIIENTANHKDVFMLLSVIDSIQINNKSFHFPMHNFPALFLVDIESSFAIFENNLSSTYLINNYNHFFMKSLPINFR